MPRRYDTRYDFDLIVIGTGAGGNVAAHIANSKGKRVALFEREAVVGGECPNWGCVPTKALLNAAEHYKSGQNAPNFGIKVGSLGYDYKKVRAYKTKVVERTGTADGDETFRKSGIKVIHSDAHFLNRHEVTASGKRYTAKNFVIATGTSDFIPPVEGLTESGYITFKEAIDLKQPPKSLLVIGGGAIGCEFTELFTSFGSKVHLVEAMPRLLGREEPEAADLLKALFENRGVKVHTGALVTKVAKKASKKEVTISVDGKNHTVLVDEVLVASGKRPNVDFGLDNAGVVYDPKRGIKTNEFMQTTARNIFAAGDVVGPYQFTHTASYQSRIAAMNILHQKSNWEKADYRAVPRCVFVDPEIASVGITEAEARDKKIHVRVGMAPISIIGRSRSPLSPTY